jgi:hypothetical protein
LRIGKAIKFTNPQQADSEHRLPVLVIPFLLLYKLKPAVVVIVMCFRVGAWATTLQSTQQNFKTKVAILIQTPNLFIDHTMISHHDIPIISL